MKTISDLSFQSFTTYIDIILSLLYVSEDVNTAICGKQEEGCAELARSKYSTINVQIIQQPFQCFFNCSNNNFVVSNEENYSFSESSMV